jgi:Glycerophosphoryl diester phosphodiesterase family
MNTVGKLLLHLSTLLLCVLAVCTLIFVCDLQPPLHHAHRATVLQMHSPVCEKSSTPSDAHTSAQLHTHVEIGAEEEEEEATEAEKLIIVQPNEDGFSAKMMQGPAVLAHRGSRYMHAENTLSAHAVALQFASVLEMDVQQTADGELIVFHDDSVDRVTNGSGRVHDLSLAYIRSLDAAYHFSPDRSAGAEVCVGGGGGGVRRCVRLHVCM